MVTKVETWDPARGTWVAVEFLDIPEVADKLQVSESTVRRLVAAGIVHPYPAAGRQHLSAADVGVLYDALRGLIEADTHAQPGPTVDVDPALGTPIADADMEGLR